jgi:hypothetical protein
MLAPSSYRFPLEAAARESYAQLRLPTLATTALGKLAASKALPGPKGRAPERARVIQRDLRQATVYFASEHEYLKMWKAFGMPENLHQTHRAFVIPEDRVIVVALLPQESPPDLYNKGEARLSSLRELEIHQSIRYGVARLRGLRENRAREILSVGMERWIEESVRSPSPIPAHPTTCFACLPEFTWEHIGEANTPNFWAERITAVPYEIYLVGSKVWGAIQKNQRGTTLPYLLHKCGSVVQCVTTLEGLSVATQALFHNTQALQDEKSAAAVWTLSTYASHRLKLRIQEVVNEVACSDTDKTLLSEGIQWLIQLRGDTPLHPSSEAHLWTMCLNALQDPSGTPNVEKLSEILEYCNELDHAVNLPTDTRRKDHPAYTAPPETPALPTEREEALHRVHGRRPVMTPSERETVARTNKIDVASPNGNTPRAVQLVNDQRIRIVTAVDRKLYEDDVRIHSIIPIPATTRAKWEPGNESARLKGARYCQMQFLIHNYEITLVDGSRLSGSALVRHHGRTQAWKAELCRAFDTRLTSLVMPAQGCLHMRR